jgi:effector-binding domain-containing protein
MSYPCEIKDQPPQPALTIRTRSSVQNLPAVIGKSFGSIMQYLTSIGEQPAGMPYVAYFNMDMQDLDLELGFPVSKPILGKGEIQSGEMPSGKVATTLYTGAYDKMVPAYDALTQYVKDQGYEPTGVSYEFYFDPPETPPEKTRTLILFPLKPH